jgi:hypothetical protein
MKKLLSILMMLTMSFLLLAGCSSKVPSETEKSAVEEPAKEDTEDGAVKTGLAIVSSVEKSMDATADADGLAQADSVVVAVLVDKDGKILKASVDTAQTKVNFSKEGKLITDIEAEIMSKQELGDDYGMANVSSIGKEWYEQADALAEYAEGKTVEELKGLAVDEAGVPTEADLTSSVTIKVGSYVEAIIKAVDNAIDIGASEGDKMGLGIETKIANSKDAAADTDGLAQIYSYYTVTTFDADGKITSSIIDSSQCNVNFDMEGKIISDLTAPLKTKNELGYDYGMKKVSAISKEWFEQADAFAEYAVGKTAEELTGIAVDEEGHATETDLTSSVTVSIGDFQDVIVKAAKNAR